MKDLNQIIDRALDQFDTISPQDWGQKVSPHKWSKKEILGHLVDSAINNLQRFTTAQYAEQPYRLIPYQQDQLVLANRYQRQPLDQILTLWVALNRHIAYVMDLQNERSLQIPIKLDEHTTKDLSWLMNDYLVHLEHHLKQILD